MEVREIVSAIQEIFAWLWSFDQVKFLLAHIGLNVVVAIAASIRADTFLLARVGEFLWRKVLPYLGVYAVGAFLGEAAGLGVITTTAFLALETVLAADLLDNLNVLGLPVPARLTKFPWGESASMAPEE